MKSVTVLVGGRSTEHDASLHSYVQLVSCLHEAVDISVGQVVFIDRDGQCWLHPGTPRTVGSLSDTRRAIPIERPALLTLLTGAEAIFSLLHGTEGEDGAWQGVAEVFDLSGSFGTVGTAALSMNKFAFAQTAASLLETVDAPPTWPVYTASPHAEISAAAAGLEGHACVVKPNSMGASLLTEYLEAPTPDRLRAAVERIEPYDSLALIQKYVRGDEYTVGVFSDHDNVHVLPIARAITTAPLLGHREKHRAGLVKAEFLEPHDRVATALTAHSRRLFQFFGFRLWCRFDFIWDANTDRPVILEANAMPGLMQGSIYPVMLERAGFTLTDLVRASTASKGSRSRQKYLPYSISPHHVPSQQVGEP